MTNGRIFHSLHHGAAAWRPHKGGHGFFRLLLFLAILLIPFVAAGTVAAAAPPSPVKVFVVPVQGEVEPALAAFLERAVSEAEQEPGAILVLEIDTFGGRVDSALQMVETLVNLKHSRTIAFVKSKAISAGALIALACSDLAMRPSTTIGDCAPITYSEEGPRIMGEKFQSPLRATFRSLARRNNYPAVLAEAMVTPEMEVYAVTRDGKVEYLDSHAYEDLSPAEKARITARKTVVARDKLLTMDDAEALQLGFSRRTAENVEEMLAGFGIGSYELVRVEQSWSEDLGRLIVRFSPILLIIGLGALYTELKAPGFGLPGIIGIACLGLVFGNQYLVGLADYTELLFILLGVVLLAMEIFVLPGFGLAGMLGFLSIGIGMILSFQDFVIPDPNLPWQQELLIGNVIQVLGAFAAAFVLTLLFLRYLFPRLGRMVEGPYLGETLVRSHADSLEAKGVRVGEAGIARSDLRPAGKVEIAGRAIDAVSDGEFLEQGTPVVVAAIHGNRIVVKRGAA
ncbi:MAG: NfeD family protein [Thermodesulfobacteriota bacterium]